MADGTDARAGFGGCMSCRPQKLPRLLLPQEADQGACDERIARSERIDGFNRHGCDSENPIPSTKNCALVSSSYKAPLRTGIQGVSQERLGIRQVKIAARNRGEIAKRRDGGTVIGVPTR